MKTIRVKDQSTQTTPSLTSRPPFRRTVEHSTPMETPEQAKDHRIDDTFPKSSNLILEPSKTPLNFDESSSPHFKLSVDETSKDYSPKSRIKQTCRSPSNNDSRKKLKLSQIESPDLQINHHDNHEQSSESQAMNHAINRIAVIDNSMGDYSSHDPVDVEPDFKILKKRGRPKKSEASEKQSVKKAATVPAQKMAKNEQKVTKSETMATRKSGAKQYETPVTTKKSSISVTRMEETPEEEKTEPRPKTPRSPRTKREKLGKQRENLMKKIENLELKLEECKNPNPNLRRSMRIREKMIRNYHDEISVLMNLVHFVESQDEILMRQQRRFKEKSESIIRRPVGRRAKQLRIVSDEDSNSS
ncbi:hypothetical protein BpHYR1_036534 [Brachionus plicatilis]|uniref:Uncharacterized protein n=1 Tax=Brachionus plicatilis TaxID=10195 RepID=A0A3M7QMF6_BRAPC|nr:hypothetical protein BpHYR1_036534 [Brachionus plicatilis]